MVLKRFAGIGSVGAGTAAGGGRVFFKTSGTVGLLTGTFQHWEGALGRRLSSH